MNQGPDASHDLTRPLLGIGEVRLRVAWLADWHRRTPTEEAALALDALCEQADRADPRAREALLAVAVFFAGLGPSPALDDMREVAQELKLLSLDRLIRSAPETVERDRPVDELPVPDYGTGRELTLGERRSLARRPTRAQLEKLLLDPHPMVLGQLFENPKLTENDVLRITTKRPARPEALRALARDVRWMSRGRVRLSLVLNPGCPPDVAMPLVSTCRRDELGLILKSTAVSLVIRGVARELLELRPPLGEAERRLQ